MGSGDGDDTREGRAGDGGGGDGGREAVPPAWRMAEVRRLRDELGRAIDGLDARTDLAADAVPFAGAIVETLHEPLLVLRPDLVVQTANPAFYRHFGVTPADTLGRRVYDLGNGQWNIPALRRLLEEILPTNKVFTGYEVSHAFEGLGRRVMLLNGRQLDHAQMILLGIRDVTAEQAAAAEAGELKTSQTELRVSEERFQLIADNVNDYGIFMADASGTITSWNPGAEQIFGYTRDEIVGRDARILFTPEDQATGQHEQELELARQTGRASDDRWQMRKGGERFWAGGVTSAMRDAGGTVIGFIKILRDETQRKQTEEQLRHNNESLEQRVAERTGQMRAHQRQLRSLVAELGRAEIRERQRLATELHDNLAQLLAACKLRASAIEAAAKADAKVKADAAGLRDALGEAITYTRGLMTDLRPDVLNADDLTAAVEWVAKRMARHGLKVEVSDDGKPKPLDPELLGFFFQAVRELLWNVVKHARTTEAIVKLERPDGFVRVTVEDQGVGFNPAKRAALPSEEGGYGLFSIAERVDLLGGRLEIESGRRKGTRVTLTAPLEMGHTPPPPSSEKK